MEKTVHLLRHAQAYNNVVLLQLLDYKGIMLRPHHVVEFSWSIWRLLLRSFNSVSRAKMLARAACHYPPYERFDPSLTRAGWEQVEERRESMAKTNVELVVVSPLTRALQTAAGVFGRGTYRVDEELPPLMAGRISSAGCPPVLAVELLREKMKNYPSNRRRRLSEIRLAFPAVDFAMVDGEEDELWNAGRSESRGELFVRANAFVDWLWNRPEKEIAVVSHGAFLRTVLGLYGSAGARGGFDNCELRTVKMRKSPTGNIVFDEI